MTDMSTPADTKTAYIAMVSSWPRAEILKCFRAAGVSAHAIKTNHELAERLWLRVGRFKTA